MAHSVRGIPSNSNVVITEVTVENFRCFSSAQTVPIAPLTFLVGENSSGKTSLLAITQVLWDMAFRQRPPTFNEPPFDLGGFDEIVFKDSAKAQASAIHAGFGVSGDSFAEKRGNKQQKLLFAPSTIWRFQSLFEKHGDVSALSARTISQGEYEIQERYKEDELHELDIRSPTDRQTLTFGKGTLERESFRVGEVLPSPDYFLYFLRESRAERKRKASNSSKSSSTEEKFLQEIREFFMLSPFSQFFRWGLDESRYATSPVRSKPARTYHATNYPADPEGNYVPFYLANVSSRSREDWKSIVTQLQDFGREMGLFDRLSIKRTAELDGSPFQIHVRMPSVNSSKELNRSLVDVGYGVSQALPIMVSLLDKKSAPLTLLQQPEIHLHPKAQAAMGDVLCKYIQSAKQQLMVETHSDYLIERVRIHIKEKKLHPSLVIVLFFERTNRGVRIHPIRFDHLGNVVDAPQSYREFFLDEMDRSMGLD